MTGADLSPAVSMACEKETGYFSTHSLGEMVSEAGVAGGAQAVRSLTWCLIKDKEHGLVHAIAAGLRESISGDDEFARMVSAAAGMVRHDLSAGPVVDALVSAGESDPAAAALAAERLVGLGDADYAAFLIGGAYGGAAPRCDVLTESLASSGPPAKVAASLRSLRVAHTEHGAPGAGRIADAVDRALRIDDGRVHREAMAALLDIRAADRDRAGRAIRSLAMRRRVCRPLPVSRIADAPFDAAECIDLLDVCTDGVSADDRYVVYDAYRALKGPARNRPGGVARLLARLAGGGAHIDARAGPVLEELGRHHPRRAAEAVLSLLGRPSGADPAGGRLPSMIRHAARFSDPKEFAGTILEALDSEPGM